MTFRQEADAYIDAHRSGWKNAKHAEQWRSTLETYVYSTIGDVSVADVDTGMLVRILEPIWSKKTETANRIRGRIERILSRAASRGHRSGENPRAGETTWRTSSLRVAALRLSAITQPFPTPRWKCLCANFVHRPASPPAHSSSRFSARLGRSRRLGRLGLRSTWTIESGRFPRSA